MNVKKIALAALVAASAGTHAQSVTIYGLVDLSVERLNNVGEQRASLVRMPNISGAYPSRLGFRGSEDLGGGVKAIFTLEAGFAPDSGVSNQGGRLFGRQAFAGLQSNWGTLTAGRQYTMLYWALFDSDILGPNMYSSGSLDSYFPNARVDNSLAYRVAYAGFDLGATYSLGRDAVNASSPSGTNCPGESATDRQACREWSVLVKYDQQNWGVAASVDRFHGGQGAFAGLTSSSLTDRRATLGGWIRVADLKLGAGVVARRNEGIATPKSKLWYAGATYLVDPAITLDGEVFKLDYTGTANNAVLVAGRATYNFSKRTAVYATTGHIDNRGSLAISVDSNGPGGAPAAGQAQSGFGVGMRHSF